jgi:hypothetical protein
MAVLYGADQQRAEKEMKKALDFEMALANASLKLKHLMTVFNFI